MNQPHSINRLMLIDDDEINNFVAEEWMKANVNDIDFVAFTSVEDALQHLRSCTQATYPQLIICDLKMPMYDGFEFIELYENEFYTEYPDTQLVILSSSLRKQDIDRAESYSSVSKFVAKQSVQDNFSSILENHLAR